jgi:RNA polymerase subunit RPABC4/transcription elongation factor Spt4
VLGVRERLGTKSFYAKTGRKSINFSAAFVLNSEFKIEVICSGRGRKQGWAMSESMFKRPEVSPFVECPNCKRLLEYGADKCPVCREEIDADYALLSALVIQHNTQAISLANTIKTAEPAAVLICLTTLIGYFLGSPSLFIINLLMPVLSLLIISVWFYRYGRFKIGDEEYVKAKREMSASGKLWLALLAAELIVMLYLLKGSSHSGF